MDRPPWFSPARKSTGGKAPRKLDYRHEVGEMPKLLPAWLARNRYGAKWRSAAPGSSARKQLESKAQSYLATEMHTKHGHPTYWDNNSIRAQIKKLLGEVEATVAWLRTSRHAEWILTAYGRETVDAVINLRCKNFKSLFDAFGFTPADLPWFMRPTADIGSLVRAARIEYPPELNGVVPADMRKDVPLRPRKRVRESVSDADLAKLRESEPAPSTPLPEIPLWAPTPANQLWEPLAQWAMTRAPICFGDILLHRDPYEPEPEPASPKKRKRGGGADGDGATTSSCVHAGSDFDEDEFEVEAIVDSMVNSRTKDAYGRIKYKIYWRHHGVESHQPWTPAPDVVPTAPEAVAEFHRINPTKPKPTPEQLNAWIPWLDEEERLRKAEEAAGA
ncbi:hypothetical protein H9P43_003483 [Blastocladiella emersonii ATCC 22665]|nr:hypothetical protein H9P43_003483 [Blastocladiella emersonii ATCC 22665]